MRRILVALALVLAFVIPAVPAAAEGCPAIYGEATLNWGSTGQGLATVNYDGERMTVPFQALGARQTGPRTLDVYFDWYFPGGTVSMVEHASLTPLGYPLQGFNSTVIVNDGGAGTIWWGGISNQELGKAKFTLSGNVCVGV